MMTCTGITMITKSNVSDQTIQPLALLYKTYYSGFKFDTYSHALFDFALKRILGKDRGDM